MLSRHRSGISLLILISIISCVQCSLTPRASDLSSFGKVKHRRTRRKYNDVCLDISPIRTRGGGDTHISQTYKKTCCKDLSSISIHHDATSINVNPRGGGDAQVNKPPSRSSHFPNKVYFYN